MSCRGMIADVITIKGNNGEPISKCAACPRGSGPFPDVVLIHHAPGPDAWYMEATRRFARHGYAAICRNYACHTKSIACLVELWDGRGA